ncbi:hypothetical protein [Burkholderia gladioli]|uniref:hypothetical protein n=1 Tax=Burkholderia gladioli TaxID=28095 RepID=UPI00163FE72F|nr:hypothetical protein [Burkholderia gladioli]
MIAYRWIHAWCFYQAMNYAMRKPAPDRIPLSGEGLASRDYFVVRLVENPDWNVLIEGLDGKALVGRAWVARPRHLRLPNSKGFRIRINVDAARLPKIAFQYYRGRLEYNEHSAGKLCLGLWGGYWLDALIKKFQQGRYNRRTLNQQNRLDLMRWLVDNALDSAQGVERIFRSSEDILTLMHGRRWARRDDALERMRHLELLLSTMRESGLVESDSARTYRATAKAFEVLENYWTDERRHADNERMQRRLFWVAVAAGGAAVIQALAAFWPLRSEMWAWFRAILS